jgi:hypothetical protein
MCTKHYTRWVRYGDVEVVKKTPRDGSCLVTGCTSSVRAAGYCGVHYRRWKKHGDPNHLEYAPRGSGTTNKKGYRAIFIDGRSQQEHRVHASRFLGRELLALENIHHRNGNRSDNTVGTCLLSRECSCPDGPHNLELWSKAQPAGKRVADLVAYAREILKRYDQ